MEEFALKNGKKLVIRQVKGTDVDEVQKYLQQMSGETIFTNQYVGRPFDREKSIRIYEYEHNLFLGAFEPSGRLVAIASIMVREPDHPWVCGNSRFGISMLKDYYGQGLGTRLMQLMEQWAKEHHVHTIIGEVRTTNRRGIALYLKQGFKICGHLQQTALIDNVWHDEYIIQKIIE